jgi:pimeloyl-ACP methyl ester carboxylesterase
MNASKLETGTVFGLVRQIKAGVLNTGYVEAGPTDGPAVVLLHGWPYGIHSFAEATPLLAAEGYRVIVPPSAARPDTPSTGASSPSSSGNSPHRTGPSTTTHWRGAPPPSTTPITSRL